MTNSTVSILLQKAENDLKVAITLLNADEVFPDSIAFHIQQSMEKNLKAYLLSQLSPIDKTHDLIALLRQCVKIDTAFEEFIIPLVNKMNDFAVQIRYDYVPDVNIDLLIAAHAEASRIQDMVLTKIFSSGEV